MTATVAIGWQSVVDFVVLAATLYVLLRWAQRARALRIALSVAGLHAGALAARYLDLIITSWILESSAIVVVVLLVVIFHPEMRHALMRLDTMVRHWPRPPEVNPRVHAVSDAAFQLARSGQGALIVVVRRDSISELLEGGAALDAVPSAELLVAIFQKASPLHDGAVIVDQGRIARAGVVLPLTERSGIPAYYGTRHRAALGLAERTDALVVAVSEERREVTLVEGRTARVVTTAAELAESLRRLQSRAPVSLGKRLRSLFAAHLGFKFAAIGLAALFWGMSFLPTTTTVRMLSVPVEFRNVPAGMQVTRQSADRLDVQLRGNGWIMDSVGLGRVVARFDLSGAKEGWITLRVDSRVFDLPPGVGVDQASPKEISVRLSRRP